jgi:O-antigen/teichoic acid export membrane protein
LIRQTLSLIIAQVLGRFLGLILLIMLAGTLGAEVVGAYGMMTTLLMLSVIVSTFGIDLWLSRHVANESLSGRGFWQLVGVRVALSAVILSVFAILFWKGIVAVSLHPYSSALGFMLIALFFEHIGMTSQSVLEGRKKLSRIALLIVVRWTVFAVLGLWVLFMKPDFTLFCLTYLGAAIVRALGSLMVVRDQFDSGADGVPVGDVLTQSLPMALLNTMVGVYFHIDMLMIPELARLEGAGYYKMAYMLVEALLFLSGAVASTLFPVFSKSEIEYRVKWEQFVRGAYVLMLIAFPISFCTPFVSSWIFEHIFRFTHHAGEFLPSARALNILVWALPAMFLNSSLVRLFLGLHRQKQALAGVSLTALVNVVLNLLLLPRIGFCGAAFSTVVSETVLTVFLCSGLVYAGDRISLWKPLIKPFLLSLFPFLLAWLGTVWLGLAPIILVPLVAISFAALLFVGRFVTVHELKRFGTVD